ncbi:hypothetical protein J3A98_003148 [Pseudomonas sp. BP6]|nr:hypothetical protein [Pseudomonas sp. BP6]MBP2288575.1 hypothetical protein [Pseudomonas sp. BP7]
MLRQRFADLDINSIVDELLRVVKQMAMIVAGSTITGGLLGAGVGAFAGGAGTIPFAGAGAAMGLKVSGWILGALGLASIAEFFIDGLPRIGEYYVDGIRFAWEGTCGNEGTGPFCRDDPYAISRATHQIAQGHVEVVVLLLGQSCRTSPAGAAMPGCWPRRWRPAAKARGWGNGFSSMKRG